MADELKSVPLTAALHDYLVDHGTPPDLPLQRLIERTNDLGEISRMQVAPEQGAFLTLLTATLGTRRAVEVGTFTGYSSTCIARGLAPGGRLLCCDVSEEWTAIARDAWTDAGVDDAIELRLAPALDTLKGLPDAEPIDLAFIDADKGGYLGYLHALLDGGLLAPDGLICVDNTLLQAEPYLDREPSANGAAIAEFNRAVAADPRVEQVMVPLRDGLTLIIRT